MEKKVIFEQENPLFSRREMHLEVKDSLTPSNEVARELVAKEAKSKPELVRVRKIDSKFGSDVFVIIADVYSSQEEFNRVVKRTKQEIKAEEEAKKAALEAKKAEEEAKRAAEEALKAEAEAPKEEEEKTE